LIKIVPYKNSYFHLVKELLVDAFSDNFDKDFNKKFDNFSSNFGFVVETNNKVIGYASIHIIDKINRRSCLIEDVVIDKNYRSKGIGRDLIDHLINYSKNKKCDKIILNSSESNIIFYEKLGFKRNEVQMIIRN
jgi:ribosomal protein S18 acetylase RimI-like enzyme